MDQTPLVSNPRWSKQTFFVRLRRIAMLVTANPPLDISVLEIVRVREKFFVVDGEGGKHAEPFRAAGTASDGSSYTGEPSRVPAQEQNHIHGGVVRKVADNFLEKTKNEYQKPNA
jgi:hypothetical protein